MEIETLRTFDHLNHDEKVNAILGAVDLPVSKELALDLAGIDYAKLTDEKKAEVDNVFASPNIEKTEGDVEKFILSPEAREKLAKDVDIESVHEKIANKLMADLDFDI